MANDPIAILILTKSQPGQFWSAQMQAAPYLGNGPDLSDPH